MTEASVVRGGFPKKTRHDLPLSETRQKG